MFCRTHPTRASLIIGVSKEMTILGKVPRTMDEQEGLAPRPKNRKTDGVNMLPKQRPAGKHSAMETKAAGQVRVRGDYYLGLLLSLVWLLFLVLPIYGLFTSDLSTLRIVAAFAAIAGFVAAYLWLVLGSFFYRSEDTGAAPSGTTVAALVTLTLLIFFLTIFYDTGWMWFLIFASTSSAMRLPIRQAIWVIASLMVVTVGTGWISGVGWQELMTIELIVGGTGLSVVATSRMLSTIRELHAAREEVARLAVSEERLRFARDLHDLLGHSLSLITLKSELAGRLLPDAPEKAAEEVRDIEGTAREALREVREAVAGYRLPTLAAELEGAREMLDAAGIFCRVEQSAGTLPSQADAVFAWAIREGVTNVIRHSRARNCEIRVTRDGGETRVEIVDDGRGVATESAETAHSGSGLRGLAERVAEARGRVECGLRGTKGFRIVVTLPPGDNVLADEAPLPTGPERARAGR